MTLVRRFLTLVAFAFWQGGFTFYTAVVVPIGADVLGSTAAQGFVTRQVTYWMNIAGVVAGVFLLWDALATSAYRRSRITLVALLTLGLLLLLVIHPRLDALMDAESHTVANRGEFHSLHRAYLWISTAQWFAGVVYLLLTPLAWRCDDRQDRR